MIRNVLCLRFAANLDYARQLVAGLSAEQADQVPAPGMNTPRWIMGHLAQTADQVTLGLVFEQPRVIPEWDAWFDAGTQSVDLTADQNKAAPNLDGVMERLENLHGVISELVTNSSPDFYERSVVASAPEGFRAKFPTVGNALAHTMLLHEMQHLGQLSAWRRVSGLPAV